ncbi:MAG TPA: hypothetical protein VLA88_02560 [Candidatus Saccharimonadales bacterium]|nr:hypothetical protein [Candidatus Saccharimonadales bacterium]
MSLEHGHPLSGERATELNGIAAVEAFLDTPEHRDLLLKRRAVATAASINNWLATADERARPELLPKPTIYHLNEAQWSLLYEAQLATIVIDLDGCFEGSPLTAIAAQRLRLQNEPACNIIFIASSTDCGDIVTTAQDEHRLEIKRGIAISGDGKVFVGDFPEPVVADALETVNMQLLTQCADKGITTLNSPAFAAEHNNKGSLAPMATAGVRTPQRFSSDELWQDDEQAEYVIKPSNASGGRGVKMFKGVHQRALANDYYHFLAEHGYKPVIEHRVTSWPLFARDERTGERVRQDWNARAIVGNGELVDLYIRMDSWGKTINRGQGARMVRLQDLAQFTEDKETATRLTETLLYAGHAAARLLPTGVAGLDITVGEDEEPYLYEVNVGNTGGIQTIAELNDDVDRKLLAPQLLVKGWLREFDLQREARNKEAEFIERAMGMLGLSLSGTVLRSPGVSSEKLKRDVTQLSIGLNALESQYRMVFISEAELRAYGATPMELALWTESSYAIAPQMPQLRSEHFSRVTERYANLAPLEFFNHLPYIAEIHPSPRQLLPYVAEFEKLFPYNVTADLTRITIYSRLHAPHMTREAVRKLATKVRSADRVLHFAEMASAACAYSQEDIELTDEDHDSQQIEGIYRLYFQDEYRQALKVLRQRIAAAEDDNALGLFANIGLQMALAERDPAAVTFFVKMLKECDDQIGARGYLGSPEFFSVRDKQTLETIVAYSTALGDTVSTLGNVMGRSRELPAGEAAEIIETSVEGIIAQLHGIQPHTVPEFKTFLRTFIAGEPIRNVPVEGAFGLIAQVIMHLEAGMFDVHSLVDKLEADRSLKSMDRHILQEVLHEGRKFWDDSFFLLKN